jgi:hypothetical protein
MDFLDDDFDKLLAGLGEDDELLNPQHLYQQEQQQQQQVQQQQFNPGPNSQLNPGPAFLNGGPQPLQEGGTNPALGLRVLLVDDDAVVRMN